MSGPHAFWLLLQVTAGLSVALLAGWLMRHGAARERHRLWTGTFVVLAAWPLLVVTLPSWSPPVPTPVMRLLPTTSSAIGQGEGSAWAARAVPVARSGATLEPASERPDAITIVVGVWLTGALGALIVLVIGLARTARLIRQAQPIAATDARGRAWRSVSREVEAALGIRRKVELRRMAGDGTALAGGFLRPVVLLPASADAWSDGRRRAVLLHELIHVRRRDGWRLFLARVVGAVLWFHPLVRMLHTRAVEDCERACDEAVVALGTRPSDYARHLLALAEGLSRHPRGLATVPMLRTSQLERRIMSILRHPPQSSRRAGRLLLAGTLALFGVVVAAQPPAVSPSPVAPVVSTPTVAAVAPVVAPTPPVAPAAPVAAMPSVAAVEPVAPTPSVAPVAPTPAAAPVVEPSPDVAPVVAPSASIDSPLVEFITGARFMQSILDPREDDDC